MNNNIRAFTVIELIIILVIISILVTLAVPEVLDARRNARSLACGVALSQIEAAKSAWVREFPGAPLTNPNQLLRYFPGGQYPKDPYGKGFLYELDLTRVADHIYNGLPAYEPAGASTTADTDNNGVADIRENGHNDVGRPRM
jgi:type II secretory pathway pseudopilin PulG